MTKIEVFNYLNSVIDKSGNLKKIGGFRKHFPELYNEFIHVQFPDEMKDLSFKQKLWHFLNDIYIIPVCKICGNPVSFMSSRGCWGYHTYCSGQCAMRDEEIKEKLNNTKFIKYGDYKYNNSEKQKETVLKRDKSVWEEINVKSHNTRQSKNGGKYFSNESIQKMKNTTKERYGEELFVRTNKFLEIIQNKHDEIQEKQYITKSKNNSFNKSGIEEKFNNYLIEKNINYIRQYKSELYPYSCDFYFPDYNLYLEIQGHWTHGKHPFDRTCPDDIDKLNLWKSKNTKFYKQAIHVWTELDVKKREIAHNNHLNYLEIFSDRIDVVIFRFEQWLEEYGK